MRWPFVPTGAGNGQVPTAEPSVKSPGGIRQSWSIMIRCPAQARKTCFEGTVVVNVIVTISVTVSPVPLPSGVGSEPVKMIVAVDDGVQFVAIELPGPKTTLGLFPTAPDGSSVVVPD